MNKLLYITLFLVILVGCLAKEPPVTPDQYHGLQLVPFNNGLTNTDRIEYYHKDEGIRYLPVNVLKALNRPLLSGIGLYNERFLATPERYGLYRNLLDVTDNLPIGITTTNDEFVSMAGINCATCHTAMITYQGRVFFVDGASSQFAIDRFIKEMIFASLFTLLSPYEFDAFYARYEKETKISSEIDKKYNETIDSLEYAELVENKQLYKSLDNKELKLFLNSLNAKLQLNEKFELAYPTDKQLNTKYKMFVYMTKRVKFFLDQADFAANPEGSTVADSGLGRSNPWGVTKNLLAQVIYKQPKSNWLKNPGGPINTPFIWNYDRLKWIFVSGVTNSMVQRNLAQGIALVTDFDHDTYETVVSLRKLEQLAHFNQKIVPPVYPEHIFGSVDKDAAERGKVLFKSICLSCHNPFSYLGDDSGSININYLDVGTDPSYIEGQLESFYGDNLFRDVLTKFLKKATAKAIEKEKITNPEQYQEGRLPAVWRAPESFKYEAKPLYGIWATGPYLHNGSVLNIRELLTPAKYRLKSFYVGSYEFDPDNIGFKNEEKYYSSKLVTDCKDSCKGNSNSGHEFGVNLPNEDKNALIEFLKVYTEQTQF